MGTCDDVRVILRVIDGVIVGDAVRVCDGDTNWLPDDVCEAEDA